MSVGYITTSDGKQLILEVFSTPNGRVEDIAVIDEEELTAAGVDGRRFRTVGNRYRQFTATVLQTCSAYTNAINTAQQYDGMRGTNVAISVTIGGSNWYYKTVHVVDARMRAMPGKVAGATNAATHAAYVVGELDLVVIETNEGSNP